MKRTAVWKFLVVGLLAAPLPFACGSGENLPDAAIPAKDAATSIEVPAVADAEVALDVALGVDAPWPTDTFAFEAAGTAVDVETAIDLGTACTIIPAFKGGTIAQDLILTRACSPYAIDQHIWVGENATLTVEPGVTLKFKKDVMLAVGYTTGKLVAEGTAALPITFTTSSSTPTAGDWTGIKFHPNTMTGTKLSYVLLDYCGKTGSACAAGALGLPAGTVTMDNVTIDHVGATADGILQDHNTFRITNTTFNPGAIAAGRSAIRLDATSFAGIGPGNVFNNAPINVNGGNIDTSATWINPATPIVVKSTFVVEGTTSPVLTLSPGTLIKFDANTGIRIATGGLVAEGTALAPIAFTSSAATPSPGDWGGVRLLAGTAGGTKFTYVTFDYCGPANGACIDVGETGSFPKPDRVEIDHVTFAHVGARANGINDPANARYRISNCTFAPGAIQAGQYAMRVLAGSFSSIAAGNVYNGALININGGDVDATTAWADPGTPVAVTKALRISGPSTPILTIAPRSIFKFAPNALLLVGDRSAHLPGKLIVSGTATDRVTFTSLAAVPTKGDWAGIQVVGGSQAVIDYADIQYAGAALASIPQGGVVVLDLGLSLSTLTMTNSTIVSSAGYGVYIPCGKTTVSVTNGTFTNNAMADQGPGPVCP